MWNFDGCEILSVEQTEEDCTSRQWEGVTRTVRARFGRVLITQYESWDVFHFPWAPPAHVSIQFCFASHEVCGITANNLRSYSPDLVLEEYGPMEEEDFAELVSFIEKRLEELGIEFDWYVEDLTQEERLFGCGW